MLEEESLSPLVRKTVGQDDQNKWYDQINTFKKYFRCSVERRPEWMEKTSLETTAAVHMKDDVYPVRGGGSGG